MPLHAALNSNEPISPPGQDLYANRCVYYHSFEKQMLRFNTTYISNCRFSFVFKQRHKNAKEIWYDKTVHL